MLLDASIAVVVRQGVFKTYYDLQELSFLCKPGFFWYCTNKTKHKNKSSLEFIKHDFLKSLMNL